MIAVGLFYLQIGVVGIEHKWHKVLTYFWEILVFWDTAHGSQKSSKFNHKANFFYLELLETTVCLLQTLYK